MGLDADHELLGDFLTEAGEILDLLNEQLVDLEHRPDDHALLNAVFRGFHTIKGGAGFLQLHAIVAVCHRAEDVFNLLRNGVRQVNAELMDVILPVLDVVNNQFASLRAGENPVHAPDSLISALEQLSKPPQAPPETQSGAGADVSDPVDQEFEQLLAAAEVPASAVPADNNPPAQLATISSDDISEDEFDALLDELHGRGGAPGSAVISHGAETSDDITEAEFDALLDQLHGSSGVPGKIDNTARISTPLSPVKPSMPVAASTADISEAEFDALLDSLHGKSGVPGADRGIAGDPTPASKPAPPVPSAVTRPAVTASTRNPVQPEHAGKTAPGNTHDASSAAQADNSIRVDTRRLDHIMNLVGELVLVRNRISTLESSRIDDVTAKVVANLDIVTSDLHAAVMKTRMQPVKKVFGRFPRVVRDLSRTLKKQVQLELVGEETDLDKNLVDALADPLVHLVRNAVDHGIEIPEVRERAGKPSMGTVILAARQEGDHILLSIQDDGAGIDAEKLRQKVVEKGLMDEVAAQRLDKKDCFNLIFMPGFSTKEEISDVSGRGVGMDVVRSRINQLNGSVDIDSTVGMGTTLTIKVPLTLAIMPTLMVHLGAQVYALPLVNVNEILNIDLTRTNKVDGQEVVLVRDRVLPVFYLARWLSTQRAVSHFPHEGHVVVVNIGSQQIGLVVDDLIGQEEVVIKPLGPMLQRIRGLAGATITGNGRVALILDLQELLTVHAVAG